MPKPAEIIAALANTSAIDSEATLRAEMVDLFTGLADRMSNWNDSRPALIMRKMAATIDAVPYDMLAELGHSYNPALISYALVPHAVRSDPPDYSSAFDLVEALLDELRIIDLDHPDTVKRIEEIEAIILAYRHS